MVSCSGSWSFQDWVPKLELGNQLVSVIYLCIARMWLAKPDNRSHKAPDLVSNIQATCYSPVSLVPKLQLGNPEGEALASRNRTLEFNRIPKRNLGTSVTSQTKWRGRSSG